MGWRASVYVGILSGFADASSGLGCSLSVRWLVKSEQTYVAIISVSSCCCSCVSVMFLSSEQNLRLKKEVKGSKPKIVEI